MVMAQSLYMILLQRYPGATIDVIAPAWTSPLVERMPEVREAILLEAGHGELKLRKRWGCGRELRTRRYAQAIVLPRSLKSALIPFAARAKRRTGYLGELRFGLLNDIRRLDRVALPRTVDRFVALGLAPGEPVPAVIPYPRLQPRSAEGVLARLHISTPQAPIMGLCPGAEYGPAKRWPPAHFAAIARAKLQEGWQVWLFGSSKDLPISAEIHYRAGAGCLDLTGKTTLGEAVDLLALCQIIVTNDSGLMHVAASLGRPVVALYGSSDPGHTPPLSDHAVVLYQKLPCSPCFQRECPLGHRECLQSLHPNEVLQALTSMTC
jgi:heptosyltransferase-2